MSGVHLCYAPEWWCLTRLKWTFNDRHPVMAVVGPDTWRTTNVPEISRFLGIVVYMLYDDHRPPHFHAEYGDYKVSVEIHTGIVEGRFPRLRT